MILMIYMTFSHVEVYETSAGGNKLSKINFNKESNSSSSVNIQLIPTKTYQSITGFGGSFTESSAYLLSNLNPEKRKEIIDLYFAQDGADYSLTRTHINSCDFSLGHYSYSNEEDDKSLASFNIDHDKKYLIPVIQDAMQTSKEGFKIIASPWTAPPWMKDNRQRVGGKLLPEYYDTWARYIGKYINTYDELGIKIWGITVENEPLGNDDNWESMHFTPQEMNRFVANHLRPILDGKVGDPIKILGFDQNRDRIQEWADEMYDHLEISRCYDGMAVHWYASTYKVFSKALQYTHEKAPEKYLINTEACIDAQVPVWQDDEWYWSKNATDWGWDWAPEDEKYLHSRYVPVFRYARDIIGCLNNWVDGWIDWNMVLNRQGGPNWAQNWCIAPVIVDEETDEYYITPLYYVIAHFSKFIRPGAQRIGVILDDTSLLATAVKMDEKKFIVIVLNQDDYEKNYSINLENMHSYINISRKAIQTIELTM